MASIRFHRSRRKECASALVYVLVIAVAMGTVLVTLIGLTSRHYLQQNNEEQDVRARYAFEGGLAYARYYIWSGVLTVPTVQSGSIGGFTINGTISDNSSSIADTASIAMTTTRWGRSFRKTYVFGNAGPVRSPTLWNYAVALNSTVAINQSVQTDNTYASANWYSNSNFSVSNWSTINGNLVLTGSPKANNINVTGSTLVNQAPIPWPKLRNIWYANAANASYTGTQNWSSGVTFTTPYRLLYVNGDLNIKGTITGTGTIYVTGNVTVTGDMSYANGSALLAIVTPGSVTFQSSNASTHAVGYIFTESGIALQDSFIHDRGAIVCTSTPGWSKSFQVVFDPAVSTTPSVGVSLKLPGLWP